MSGNPDTNNKYDLIIIGGGPAGLTAGLYAARGRLATLLIEKGVIGGQITNAALVENFPGFPQGISGFELGQLLHQQATKYGLETIPAEVTGVEFDKAIKVVRTGQGEYQAKAVIIAGGSELSKLGVPGEEKLLGRGVSYCATCDGAFFRDKMVVVLGGGDAAITEAIHLTNFASKVTVVHRRDELRASKILQEKAFADPKMDFLWDSVVEEIIGDNVVEGLKVRNVKSGENSTLEVSGVFIYVGLKPNTDYLKEILKLDEKGHILVNTLMETGVEGVFAAGDVRHDSARQAVTATGDGATAAISAERFIRGV
ncbi:thioredoxin-disulfide reductase [Chloroflexota bacterium]